MNANELADELEDCEPYNVMDTHLFKAAATMLRQQADRIGVLEANHKIQLNINEKALQYIEQLEQGLRASIDLNNAQAKRAQGK
jgi:hypothetical protein